MTLFKFICKHILFYFILLFFIIIIIIIIIIISIKVINLVNEVPLKTAVACWSPSLHIIIIIIITSFAKFRVSYRTYKSR